jgi:iron complex transport system ATP-binding protein
MSALFAIDTLSAGYAGCDVLHGLSFELLPGRFYGLVGPNGSGKTTLIDLLLANLIASEGTILFRGREVGEYSRRELAREIALVPQEFRIDFDFSVQEVVMMGRHPHLPRFANPGPIDLQIVDQALAELEITDLRERLVTHLSGGEKQRVIVARALAQDTPVLVLDEATSSLDIQHSLQIFQVLKKRCRERQTSIIAAIHDLNFAAAYCDAIILLNHGRLVTIGPPGEVLTPELLGQVFAIDCQAFTEPFAGIHQVAYRY